jgi:hypothetical protein
MQINFKPTQKQNNVFDYFNDDITTEVAYGGSLASGKTYLIASLLVMKCLQHPGIRIGLAREHLTILKKTTLTSIFEVISDWKLTKDHYNYNSSSGEIKFFNNSVIVLIELAYNPSDPLYTRLGGLLLTFGCIDEGGETDQKGKEIFQSRLGRWRNDKLGVKAFLLITCNPSKNWIYRDFYQCAKDGNLPGHRQFIQALPEDNPYLPIGYIENLSKTLTLNERRRLLLGEWEVGDEEESLFKSNDINYLFDRSISLDEDMTMRMSCDIAFTSDKCIFVIWKGLTVVKIVEKNKSEDKTTVDTIKDLARTWGIRADNISFDADGVGKYIREYLPSAKEIHNGGKAIKNDGYINLKTELYFKLSEIVGAGTMKIEDISYRNEIIEELSVIKHKSRHSMNKLELISKSDMKKVLGHSPDIADALAYGMIFLLKNSIMSSDDFVFINF